MNVISLLALIVSGGMLVISLITLSRNSHKDTKTSTREEGFREGKMDEKINKILEEVAEIKADVKKNNADFEDFKEKIEVKVKTLVDDAIKQHEAIYHRTN